MYCKVTSHNCEMYIVRQAVKPSRRPNRWKSIGHCCDDCYDNGQPISFEFTLAQLYGMKDENKPN